MLFQHHIFYMAFLIYQAVWFLYKLFNNICGSFFIYKM